MSYIERIHKTAQKVIRISKITFATTLTLAFGATMVWGIIGIIKNDSNTTMAAGEATSWCLGHETACSYTENAGVHDTACKYDSDKDQCRLKPAITSFNLSNDPCNTDHLINSYLQIGTDSVWGVTQKDYVGDDVEWCQIQGFTVGGADGMANKTISDSRYWCTSFQWDNDENEYRIGYIGDQGDVCWDAWSEADGFRTGCNAPYSGATNPNELDWDCTIEQIEPEVACNYKDSNISGLVQQGDTIEYTIELEIIEESIGGVSFYDDYDESKIDIQHYNGFFNYYDPNMDTSWSCSLQTLEGNNKVIYCEAPTYRNLEPGTYEIKYNAVVKDSATGTIHNEVITLNGNTEKITISEDCQEDVMIDTPEDVTISCVEKIASPSRIINTIDANKEIEYTIEINVADGDLDHITVYDDFDENNVIITEYPDINTGWQCQTNEGQLVCESNGAIEPIQIGTYTFSYKALIKEGSANNINNVVTKIIGEKDGNDYIWTNSNLGQICSANVTLEEPEEYFECKEKTANPSAGSILQPGDSLTYYIEYASENLRNSAEIRDRLPNGFIATSYPNNCIYSGNLISCTVEGSGTIQIDGYIDETFDGNSITNSAAMWYAGTNSEENCNTVSHDIAIPEISCTDKIATQDEVEIGDTIDYTVSVNLTNSTADELIIVDDFDEEKAEIKRVNGIIDAIIKSSNTNDQLVLDCEIEERNGNKVLKCNARTFENESRLRTGTYVLSYSATVLDTFASGTVENTIIETTAIRNGVEYSDPNPEDSCSASVGIIDPEISCTSKTADLGNAKEGDTIKYTVSFTLSNTDIDAISFIDNYDETMIEIIDNSWESELDVICNDDGEQLSCIATSPNGIIEPKTYEFTYSAQVIANIEDIAYNEITSVTTHKNGESFLNDDTEDDCHAEVQLERINPIVDCLDKEVSADEVKVGDIVRYTITYRSENQDNQARIEDPLDDSLDFIQFANGSENYCEYNIPEHTIKCIVPDSTAGTISFDARIKDLGIVNNEGYTIINNQALVYGFEDPLDGTIDPDCSINLQARELEDSLTCISKVADDRYVQVGDEINFTIRYQNTGETVLSGIELVDQLPIGITFLSSEDDCYLQEGYVGTGDNVKCESNESLEPGDSRTFVIRTKVNEYAPAGMKIQNRISHLSSGDVLGDVSECYENIYIDLPEPVVSVIKETISPSDRTITLGDDAETENDYVTFNLVVTNEGPTKLVYVPVIDLFSMHDFAFISASPAETSVTTYNGTTIIYWENIGELEVGESKTITIVLQVKETYYDDLYENRLYNWVRVQDVIDENGSEANEDQDYDYVDVDGSILGENLDFTIQKTLITSNPTTKDEEVVFRIEIWNTGDEVIEEIKFIDDYDPAYLTFVDFSSWISHRIELYSIDTVTGQLVHNNILYGQDPLQPNESIQFEITFIAENKNGETTNWATAIVEDKEEKDNAKVRIVVEILAKTGENIVIPVTLGIALILLLSKKVLVVKKKK